MHFDDIGIQINFLNLFYIYQKSGCYNSLSLTKCDATVAHQERSQNASRIMTKMANQLWYNPDLLRLMCLPRPLTRPVGPFRTTGGALFFSKLESLVYDFRNHHMTFPRVLTSLTRCREWFSSKSFILLLFQLSSSSTVNLEF